MIRRTPLHDRHLAAGGRMVEFAGWEMPVQYTSILDEHRAVREHCGIFDISHMGEFLIRGARASEWLDFVLTNRVAELRIGEAQYTLMLNEQGGIVDDLIIYRIEEQEFLLIVNAAKIDEDFAWLEKHRTGFLSHGDHDFPGLFDCSDAYAAIAVQGPKSPQVFGKVFCVEWESQRNRIVELTPQNARSALNRIRRCGARAFAATTGYTGESGFEAIIPAQDAEHYWNLFLAAGARLCGLGARDTLRLEMCYPLNGADLSPDRTPLEAGLGLVCRLREGRVYWSRCTPQTENTGSTGEVGRASSSGEITPNPSALSRPSRRREDSGDHERSALAKSELRYCLGLSSVPTCQGWTGFGN